MAKRFSKNRVDVSNAFAPWISAADKRLVESSAMFSSFLKIHAKSGLKCVGVSNSVSMSNNTPVSQTIRLGLDNGLRVAAIVDRTLSSNYDMFIYDAPDSPNTSNVGSSKNLNYLADRLLRHARFDTSVADAKNYFSYLTSKAFFAARKTARNTNRTDYDVTDDIKGDAIAWLLKLHFNSANDIDLPSGIRASIDKAYKSVCTNGINMQRVAEAMREVFCRDKWLIGYNESFGYWVGVINASKTYYKFIDWSYDGAMATEGAVDIVKPVQYYPNFESIPEELRKEIMPAQAMFNMYLDGSNEVVEFRDADVRLVPTKPMIALDAGAVCLVPWYNGASWLLLDKA